MKPNHATTDFFFPPYRYEQSQKPVIVYYRAKKESIKGLIIQYVGWLAVYYLITL